MEKQDVEKQDVEKRFRIVETFDKFIVQERVFLFFWSKRAVLLKCNKANLSKARDVIWEILEEDAIEKRKKEFHRIHSAIDDCSRPLCKDDEI